MKHFFYHIIIFICFLLPVTGYAIEGFPGKTWGELRQEFNRGGDNNLILNGWIEQGIYWTSWQNIKLNTYATLRYKYDTEELEWNNSVGPGIGVAIEKFNPDGIYVRAGIEYIWERFYTSGRDEQKAVAYISWYGWWDFLKKSR